MPDHFLLVGQTVGMSDLLLPDFPEEVQVHREILADELIGAFENMHPEGNTCGLIPRPEGRGLDDEDRRHGHENDEADQQAAEAQEHRKPSAEK